MQNPDVIYVPRQAVLKAAQEFETPFYLYNEKRIRENCRRFAGAFKKHFSDFYPLYAFKANSNPEVIKIIADEGFAIDASDEAEVWMSKKLGLGGMFTGNYNPASTLKLAKDNGFMVNLDDISMIPFLKQIGVPEFVSFRINPGIGKGGGETLVFAGPNAKYGIPFEKAPEAYKQAQELGVKRFGIHMMTGSNVPIEEKDYFAQIVEKLFEVVALVKKETGVEIELMNMGGGFGVPYRPEQESLDIDYIAQSVRGAFDEQCARYDLKEPRLMAEPGRFIMADAGWIVTKVTVIKDSYKKFVGVDASTSDNPRPAIYGAYHHISVLNGRDEKEEVAVVGSICENNDQFTKNMLLPKCSVGDVLSIHNSGAHVYAMAHNYNGKRRHAEYLLREDGSFRKIRRAETFEDIYRTVDY